MTQRTSLAALWRSFLCANLFFAFACSNSGDDNSDLPPIYSNSLLLSFRSDFATGALRWMDADSSSLAAGILDFGNDSKLSAGGGSIFVLSSSPGALACISPDKIGDKEAVKQTSLGADAMPYEAAAIGGNGYIALNDKGYVQAFDIISCSLGDKINLPIENAGASSIKASGDTLLVVLQRLENWVATKPGLLVRISASKKNIIDTIQLKLYNPHSSALAKGKLYVSSIKYNDDYSVDLAKSGVEMVDLAKKSTEVIATGEQLGGGAQGLALDEAGQVLYASVYASYGDQPVKPINLAKKTIGSKLPEISDSFGGIVFDPKTGRLFAGDVSSGLKIYDSAAKSTIAVNEGDNFLPPYSLAIARW